MEVTLAWDANAEPDIAGYRVHHGAKSRDYSETTDVGNVTTTTLELSMAPGARRYFAVTAYNLVGLESDFSEEVVHVVPAPTNPEATIIQAEAEDLPRSGNFVQQIDPEASGGAHLRVDGGGRLSFPVQIPADGSYYVWARIRATAGTDNSFFVRFDDGDEDVFDTKISSTWTWDRVNGRGGTDTERSVDPRRFSLSAGEHVLHFRNRETGILIDRIVISSNANLDPETLPAPPPWTAPEPREVILQAEAEALPRSGNYVQQIDPEASGGVHLRVDGGGQLSFPVQIPADGSYYVWARIRATDGTENSFFVRFDDGDEDVFDTEVSSTWTWDRVNGRGGTETERSIDPRRFSLSAGEHVLHFRNRETGIAIDRIVISSNANLDPDTLPAPSLFVTFQPGVGEPMFEAEAEALPRGGSLTPGFDATASGGAFLRVDGGGDLNFPVQIPASGRYYVWARIRAAAGTDNSFFVRFDDGDEDVFDTEISSTWTWDRVNGRAGTDTERRIDPRAFDVAAGKRNLRFRGRETGIEIDRILIASDPDFEATDPVGSNALAFEFTGGLRPGSSTFGTSTGKPVSTAIHLDSQAGILRLEWVSRPDAHYDVFARHSLVSEKWRLREGAILGTGDTIIWSQPIGSSEPVGIFQVREYITTRAVSARQK